MEHKLKTNTAVFDYSWHDQKPFEVRKDGRDFKVGDTLILAETRYSGDEMDMGAPEEYTGRYIKQLVIYKLSGEYGIKSGYCVLGVKTLDKGTSYRIAAGE